MRDYKLRCKQLEILLKSGSFFKQTFFNQRIVNMLNVNKKQKNQKKTKHPPPKKGQIITKIMKLSGQHYKFN